MPGDDDQDEGTAAIDVMLPSGQTTSVSRDTEAEYLESKAAEYQEQFAFTNPVDLGVLDMIVSMEMLVWRWQRWLNLGHSDDGEPIAVKQITEAMKQTSAELRLLRSSLGMDKVTRDRTTGDGSLPEFVARLKEGAKAMNVFRCEQVDITLEHGMQLITLANIWRNGDPEEQEMFGCTSDEIMQWILTVYAPAMKTASDYFATNVQSIWIREM